jgi:hypothetical protein
MLAYCFCGRRVRGAQGREEEGQGGLRGVGQGTKGQRRTQLFVGCSGYSEVVWTVASTFVHCTMYNTIPEFQDI